jgi:hypothetical protein
MRAQYAPFKSKNKGIGKQFFSEEKNQKTFVFNAIPNVPRMASIFPQAHEQKSFGSFLQKRTCFLKPLFLLTCFRDGLSGLPPSS